MSYALFVSIALTSRLGVIFVRSHLVFVFGYFLSCTNELESFQNFSDESVFYFLKNNLCCFVVLFVFYVVICVSIDCFTRVAEPRLDVLLLLL